jgi:serralysin
MELISLSANNKYHMLRNLLGCITLLVLIQIAASCNDNDKNKELQVCTELYTENINVADFDIKAAGAVKSLWPHSANFPLYITVRFMNGTDFQKRKVKEYARIWTTVSAPGAAYRFQQKNKINFRFIPDDGVTSGNVADIRILFQEGGSASYIGIDCKNIPQHEPTMFFGWINEAQSDAVIQQVVLHEFGHALGLIHEHQSPAANIPWDKEKVYEYYKNTQTPPWDRAKVDANIFARYSPTTTNYTAYDVRSIMHYAIPAGLTIGGFSTPWNASLSKLDSSFIKEIYRYYPCEVNVDCCYDRNGRRILCP